MLQLRGVQPYSLHLEKVVTESEKGRELFSHEEWLWVLGLFVLWKSMTWDRMWQRSTRPWVSQRWWMQTGCLLCLPKGDLKGCLKDLPAGGLQNLKRKWFLVWCRCKFWNSFPRLLQIPKLYADVRKKSSLLLPILSPLWLWTLY